MSFKLGKRRTYDIVQEELAWCTLHLTGHNLSALVGKAQRNRKSPVAFHKRSCLGPFLFILYTNDFEKSLSTSHPNIHANDTSIFSSNENLLQLLEDL